MGMNATGIESLLVSHQDETYYGNLRIFPVYIYFLCFFMDVQSNVYCLCDTYVR